MSLHNYLKSNILLFDGAMGTYIPGRDRRFGGSCEKANLEAPELVEQIHRAYLLAGCTALKTNTFGANRPAFGEELCRDIIDKGWDIAKNAAGEKPVFADIGPVSIHEGDVFAEYRFVVDRFLGLGAEHFLFETHSRDTALHEIAAYIRERCPEAFILVSFAAHSSHIAGLLSGDPSSTKIISRFL